MDSRKFDIDEDNDDWAPEEEPEIGNRYYNEKVLERGTAQIQRTEKKKRTMRMVRQAVR